MDVGQGIPWNPDVSLLLVCIRSHLPSLLLRWMSIVWPIDWLQELFIIFVIWALLKRVYMLHPSAYHAWLTLLAVIVLAEWKIVLNPSETQKMKSWAVVPMTRVVVLTADMRYILYQWLLLMKLKYISRHALILPSN